MRDKLKNIDFREVYIYLLILSAFISISIFEILVVIGLLVLIYDFFKRRINLGALSKPLLLYSSVALLSTSLFNPKLINKGLEQGLFQILYFFKLNNIKEIVLRINYIFIAISIILIPIVIYKYIKTGLPAPVWGGVFEVGQFYSMFSITSFLLALFFYKKGNKLLSFIFFILTFLFIGMVFFTHRRTAILGLIIIFYLTLIVLYRNRIINKIIFWSVNILLIISVSIGYWYLSKTDTRFILLNEVITGKKHIDKDLLNSEVLNIISSNRVAIFKDAIFIIKKDIEEKNIVNLVIGHGINSGSYLPHKYSPYDYGKYESIFIISEFIEIGLLGVLAELWLIFVAFKTFLKIRIITEEDIYALSLFTPLLIHLVGIAFTFFWDALLPLYLLLFKIAEYYFYRIDFD